MESESCGHPNAGELSNTLVQDTAVRLSSGVKKEQKSWPTGKVVIHKPNLIIRGTVLPDQEFATWHDPDSLSIRIFRDSSKQIEDLSLLDAKAVFFVRSLAGQADHEDLHFYEPAAIAPFLWTRISFWDGEVIECMVRNSEEMILAPAFFANAVDPGANNISMFIVKRMIKHLQILAVRH